MSEGTQVLIPFWLKGDADGAVPIGGRVVKCNSEEGDLTPDGTEGTVVSSINVPDNIGKELGVDVIFFYFIEWDTEPDLPVGVIDKKLRPA